MRSGAAFVLFLFVSLCVGALACDPREEIDEPGVGGSGGDLLGEGGRGGEGPGGDGGGAGAGGRAGEGGGDGTGGSAGEGGGDGTAFCTFEAPVCEEDADCEGQRGACFVGTCRDGCCQWSQRPEGEATEAQAEGDCQLRICDAAGAVIELPDDEDLPVLGSCWSPHCDGGSPGQAPKALGSACSEVEGGICDGAGTCVESGCENGLQDADETDVDCGGSACSPCDDGGGCMRSEDCASRVCADWSCQTPSCNDQVKNGAESGVDCGGPCGACAGEFCVEDDDCKDGSCDEDQSRCLEP